MKLNSIFKTTFMVCCLAALSMTGQNCNEVLWVSVGESEISQIDKSGSNLTTILESPANRPKVIAIHESSNRIFYYDQGDEQIKSADLAGIDAQVVIAFGIGAISGMVVDNVNDYLYWSDHENGTIMRCDLLGQNVMTIVNGLQNPGGLDIDLTAQKIYWAESGINKIRRADLDGSLIEDVIASSLIYPRGVGLDVANQKIYWTDAGTELVQRANFDGSNVENLANTNLSSPLSLGLHLASQRLFCTEWGTKKILSMDFDGGNPSFLVSNGTVSPNSIVVHNGNGRMYWVDSSNGVVQSANLDGTDLRTVFSSLSVGGLVKDVVNGTGYIYYSNSNADAIVRCDANGANEIVLVAGLNNPQGIAIDYTNARLFWVDASNKRIQSADLSDGGNLENVVFTGLTYPIDLDIDQTNGKMYWLDSGRKEINRANLDGSNIENVVNQGLQSPKSLKVDQSSKLLFWSDAGLGSIVKSSLDGNDQEVVVSGLSFVQGIALDEYSGEVYWVEAGTDEMKKALYDGSSISLVRALGANNVPTMIEIENEPCFDITEGLIGSCEPMSQLDINNSNSSQWLLTIDNMGMAAADINAQNNILGEINSRVYVDNSPVRYVGSEPYARRDIQINVEFQPNSLVKVRLFFDESEIDDLIAAHNNIESIEDVYIAKVDDSCTGTYDGNGQLVNVLRRVSYNEGYFFEIETGSFSTFYAVGVAPPDLAAQFGDLDLIKNDNSVQVDWIVESEINSNYYMVMRSTTGTNFVEVGRVQSKGIEGTELSYSVMDDNPALGLNYYKVREVDLNGSVSVSSTRSINWNGGDDKIVFYPNPSVDKITFEGGNGEGNLIYSITDLQGRLMSSSALNKGLVEVDLKSFPRGIFFVQVRNEKNEVIMTEKLVVE